MDFDRLREAAKHCKVGSLTGCTSRNNKCPETCRKGMCFANVSKIDLVLAIDAMLTGKADEVRKRVIAEVTNLAIETVLGTPAGNRLLAKLYAMELDSMDKG